jgi:hypothetical protein
MTRQMAMVGFLQAQNCRDILLHRICLLVAFGVFHCGAQNSDAIGATADIDWPPAPIASKTYDP